MGFLGFGWQAERLRERFYPREFLGMYARLLETIVRYANPDDVVLDAGCGSGRVFQHRQAGKVRPGVGRIVGIDVTDEPRENENLTDAAKGDLGKLPFRDDQFDIAIVSHVAEHLTDPEAVFGELSRVLKPGGRLLLLTPNRWHYVPLGARLLPQQLHVLFNNWRGVDTRDIFPTAYRANTAGRLRQLSEQAGLDVESLEQSETEPEYLAFHIVPYTVGVGYERLVNRSGWLKKLRVNLLLVAKKKQPGIAQDGEP